jgi:hypothetical protein
MELLTCSCLRLKSWSDNFMHACIGPPASKCNSNISTTILNTTTMYRETHNSIILRKIITIHYSSFITSPSSAYLAARMPSAHATASLRPLGMSTANQMTKDAAVHSANRKGKPAQVGLEE